MHRQHDIPPRWNTLCAPGGHRGYGVAGHGHRQVIVAQRIDEELVRTGALWFGVHVDVMHDRTVARTNLDGADPLVFVEERINSKLLIVEHAGLRHLKRAGHREHAIGADRPIVAKSRRRGPLARIARRHAGIEPGEQCRALGGSHTAIVGERAAGRAPGRHPLLGDDLAYGGAPGHGVLVFKQRKRRGLPRPVTLDATPVENRGDAASISRRHGARVTCGGWAIGQVKQAAGSDRCWHAD